MANCIKSQIKEAKQALNSIKPKTFTPRNLIIKFIKMKDEGKILKAVWEKRWIAYSSITIQMSVDISSETTEARKK